MSRGRVHDAARGLASVPLLAWLLLALVSAHAYFSAQVLRDEAEATALDASVTTPAEEEVLPHTFEHLPALTFLATAYALPGQTASGETVRQGIVAADPEILPIGSIIHLSAGRYSGIYTVLDTGLNIRGRMLDIWVPTVEEARAFGVRRVKVRVLRWGWKASAPGR